MLYEVITMDGNPLTVAPGSGYHVQIPLAEAAVEMGLLACNLQP